MILESSTIPHSVHTRVPSEPLYRRDGYLHSEHNLFSPTASSSSTSFGLK